jgi:type VII secretion integral membrane protein EccD
VQEVRDGEVLHLVAHSTHWPEPDFDDIADAIAQGSRRHAAQWTGSTTLWAGLAAAGLVLLAGLYPIASYDGTRAVAGGVALAMALLLLVVGTLVARALAQAPAGSALAAYALPYAALSGLLLAGGDPADPLAPEVLAASATLLAVSVVAYVGVAGHGRVFVAGSFIALLGCFGALLTPSAGPSGAAAVVSTVLVVFVTVFPLIAMRLGRLPLPTVPQTAADLAGTPLPSRTRLFASVARTDEILTGLLLGAAVSHVVAAALMLDGGVGGAVLTGLVACLNLLRARLFVSVRQRMPLLLAGVAGLLILGVGGLATLSPDVRLAVGTTAAVVGSVAVLATAIGYSRRTPSPYLGRAAEIIDIVLLLGVVPVACAVMGLFGWIRGLGG